MVSFTVKIKLRRCSEQPSVKEREREKEKKENKKVDTDLVCYFFLICEAEKNNF